MLAQQVASELRMHLWPLRSQTDRNTPSQMKINLGQSGYNGFFTYNGYNGFLMFLTVFRHVWGRKKLGCHHFYVVLRKAASWGHDNELSTKFWRAWKPYICCRSFITLFSYFVPAKTRLGRPPKKHMKKKFEHFLNIYSNCCNTLKALAQKKISNSPSNFFYLCQNHIFYIIPIHYTFHCV